MIATDLDKSMFLKKNYHLPSIDRGVELDASCIRFNNDKLHFKTNKKGKHFPWPYNIKDDHVHCSSKFSSNKSRL